MLVRRLGRRGLRLSEFLRFLDRKDEQSFHEEGRKTSSPKRKALETHPEAGLKDSRKI